MTAIAAWKRISAALALVEAASVSAQSLPPTAARLPPSREEVNQIPTTTRATPPARLTVTGGIERAPCALDAPRFQSVMVTLKDVVFDDLEAVDPAELRPAVAPYLGHAVPLGTICEIRDVAATILRREGYLAAVQVPPQKIGNGVIHLTVLMAKLVAVHVRGNPGHAEKLIAAYLERLKNGKPFNQKEAERALLLAGDLPGYDIRLALRPAGTVPGEVIGDVTVSRTPIQVDVSIQNFGSRAVGRWSGLARAQLNDLFGIGDRAVIAFDNTADIREQSIAQFGYEVRPGSSGLDLAGRFTYAWTRPGLRGSDLLRARTLIATGEASYPLIRRQAATVRLSGGLDVIDQRLAFAGAPLTDDRLRVLYGKLDFNLLDPASAASTRGYTIAEPRWRIIGALELRHGIGGLGASHGCGSAPTFTRCLALPSISRLDADPQGMLIRLGTSFEFRPQPRFTIVISPQMQYAFNPLLSYEQYSIGNYTVGRGYDPGALSGDSGLGVQTELRIGRLAPKGQRSLAVQPFAYLDAAKVWTRGALPEPVDGKSIYSAGGGIRAVLGDRAQLQAFVAAPLRRLPLESSRGDVRFMISITASLLP